MVFHYLFEAIVLWNLCKVQQLADIVQSKQQYEKNRAEQKLDLETSEQLQNMKQLLKISLSGYFLFFFHFLFSWVDSWSNVTWIVKFPLDIGICYILYHTLGQLEERLEQLPLAMKLFKSTINEIWTRKIWTKNVSTRVEAVRPGLDRITSIVQPIFSGVVAPITSFFKARLASVEEEKGKEKKLN